MRKLEHRTGGILWPVVILLLVLGLLGIAIYLVTTQAQRSEPVSTPPPPPTDAIPPAASPSPEPRAASRPPIPPPSSTRPLSIFEYRYFTVGYDEDRRNPAWVRYDLDGPITHPDAQPPRPPFAPEPHSAAHVTSHDYTGSGYDRGHMAPSFAMWSRYGIEGMHATYVMTNVLPQLHLLNAGPWENLEDDIAGRCTHGHVEDQGWAGRLRNITVINGPIYDPEHMQYLPSGVAVPSACFSVVYDWEESSGNYRARAYRFPNSAQATATPSAYRTRIRDIEFTTGLDFMPGWGGDTETLETSVSQAEW